MPVFEVPYKITSRGELTEQERDLVKLAEEALEKAHAPYSHFFVGSAVRMSDGRVFTGNNQENAAYPSGLCAERVALFKARSETSDTIESIVVLARNEQGKAADAFCCGGCRQVIMEYASIQSSPIKILMQSKEENFIFLSDVKGLLPFGFEAKTLN